MCSVAKLDSRGEALNKKKGVHVVLVALHVALTVRLSNELVGVVPCQAAHLLSYL